MASASSLFLASPIAAAPKTRTNANPFPLFPARPSPRLRQQLPPVAAALQAEHQPAVAAVPKPPALPFRVGHGFDLHRLEPGLPLIIGGINIPHDRGCEAHSDGASCFPVADPLLVLPFIGSLRYPGMLNFAL